MRHLIIISIFFSLHAFAYIDTDLDGVDDESDRCPNTPITELVDIDGCTKRSLVSLHHYDIIVGTEYAQNEYDNAPDLDTLTTTVQVDYYYKDFSLQANTSYFKVESGDYSDEGMNDSFLAAYYQLRLSESLLVRLGAGVILPTYDTVLNNNNTDYTASASASYAIDQFNLFGSYAHTIIKDDDINTADIIIKYQNTDAYSAGVGYNFTPKFYGSIAYNTVDSVYKGVEKLDTWSLYGYYSINKHWFSSLSYAKGLSDTANEHNVAVRIGYYF